MTSSSGPTPLTTIFSAPTYCALNPSTAAWGGILSVDVELSTVSVDVITSDDSVVASTVYTTITSTPSFQQWTIGSDDVGYLKTCEPSPGTYSFSPGVCPQAWTPFLIQSSGSLTSAVCCPTGAVAVGASAVCTAAVVTPIVLNTATGYGSDGIDSFSTPEATTVSSAQIFHYGNFYVTWEASDLPQFTPASAPAFMRNGVPVDAATMTPSVTQTPTPSPSATETSISKPGLSTGALAGIGVGAGIVGLALLGAAIFLVFRTRRRRAVRDPFTYDSVPYESSYETQQTGIFKPEAYRQK